MPTQNLRTESKSLLFKPYRDDPKVTPSPVRTPIQGTSPEVTIRIKTLKVDS